MNHPIPVTITHGEAPLDLTGIEVYCQTCDEKIEPADTLRGRVIPHQHDGDGDGCSSITLTHADGRVEAMLVRVEGLTAEEMNTEHPVGLDKIVADAAKKMAGLSSGASEEWLLLQLRPFARTVMRWEREGCAHDIDDEAQKAETYARALPDGHDGESAAWSRHATLVDLAETIRDRDDDEAPAVDQTRPDMWNPDECPDCHTVGHRDGAKLHQPECPRIPKED